MAATLIKRLPPNGFANSSGNLVFRGLSGICVVAFLKAGDKNCDAYVRVLDALASTRIVPVYIADPVTEVPAQGIRRNHIALVSKGTKTEITNVPATFLFKDSVPRAIFHGERTLRTLENFVQNAISDLRAKDAEASASAGTTAISAAPRVYAPHMTGGAMAPQQVEQDDDERLTIPKGVTPHNTPWDTY